MAQVGQCLCSVCSREAKCEGYEPLTSCRSHEQSLLWEHEVEGIYSIGTHSGKGQLIASHI